MPCKQVEQTHAKNLDKNFKFFENPSRIGKQRQYILHFLLIDKKSVEIKETEFVFCVYVDGFLESKEALAAV